MADWFDWSEAPDLSNWASVNTWVCLAAFGLPFGVGMVQSWRYMKSLV